MSGTQITALGKYAIRGVLGKGAMGTVYDGWDPVIDRRVAIKTVRLPDAQDEEAEEGLARFKREAQAAGRLTHPNIVGVFDYGETDELAYIVMEFVAGRSLKDVLGANERMTPANIVKLMDDVLAGLAFSHGRGVVHRDIKPANIMLTLDDQAKIADFGIARIEASSMTQAGTVLGTPAYMSPEQFMGQVVDRRTDIYSCGVMLYQMLTGDRPFEGSMTAIMHKVLTTTPPRPSELVVTSPPALDGVVAKAMARRPEDRYDTAAEFAQALRSPPPVEADAFSADETIVAPVRTASPAARAAVAPPPKPPEPPSRSKLPVIIGGGAVAAAAIAAGVWFMLPGSTPTPTPRQASLAPTTPSPAIAPPQTPAPAAATQQASLPPPTQPAPAPQVPASPFAVGNLPPPETPKPAPPPTPAVTPPPPSSPVSSPASPFAATNPAPATAPVRTAPSLPPFSAPAAPVPAPSTATAPAQFGVASAVPPPSSIAPPAVPPPSSAAPPVPQQFASTVPTPDASRTAPPPTVATSVRSPAAIEASLAGAFPAVKCSLAHFAVASDGTATITGVTGQGQADEALRRAVANADPANVAWQVRAFDGPYCPALDVLRPVVESATRGRNGMDMVQAGGPAVLKDNDVIPLQVTMPGFSGYLHVAYLQHDATVAPQVPGPGYPSQTYAARSQVDLGSPRSDFEGWHVGPPFGTDMIVAIASSAPLFARPLPETQPLSAYLASLQTAMDGLRRRGGSLAAAAVVLDTRP